MRRVVLVAAVALALVAAGSGGTHTTPAYGCWQTSTGCVTSDCKRVNGYWWCWYAPRHAYCRIKKSNGRRICL